MSKHIINKAAIAIKAALLSLIVWGSVVETASANPVVIGYIPVWRDMAATLDATDLSLLTHINISFLNPDSSGALVTNNALVCMVSSGTTSIAIADLQAAITKAHQGNVKVLVSLGGGVLPSCAGSWGTLLQAANRQALVDNLIKFVDDYNLDGLDVDLEGQVLTSIDTAGNYTPFIKALSEKLIPKGKLLTCATASYNGGMIPTSSIQYFDYVNIMSYDAVGPTWGTVGDEHSTYAMAQSNITTWKNRGVPKSKLVLGVPFYGYGFGTYKSDYSFKEIIDLGTSNANNDVIGTPSSKNYITYNGINTIKSKTQLALQNGAGVMIWELSQDAAGSYSLLKTIGTEVAAVTSSAASSSAVSSSAISSSVASSSVASSTVTASSVAASSEATATSSTAAASSVANSTTTTPKSSGGGGASGLFEILLLLCLSVGAKKTRRS